MLLVGTVHTNGTVPIACISTICVVPKKNFERHVSAKVIFLWGIRDGPFRRVAKGDEVRRARMEEANIDKQRLARRNIGCGRTTRKTNLSEVCRAERLHLR